MAQADKPNSGRKPDDILKLQNPQPPPAQMVPLGSVISLSARSTGRKAAITL